MLSKHIQTLWIILRIQRWWKDIHLLSFLHRSCPFHKVTSQRSLSLWKGWHSSTMYQLLINGSMHLNDTESLTCYIRVMNTFHTWNDWGCGRTALIVIIKSTCNFFTKRGLPDMQISHILTCLSPYNLSINLNFIQIK